MKSERWLVNCWTDEQGRFHWQCNACDYKTGWYLSARARDRNAFGHIVRHLVGDL